MKLLRLDAIEMSSKKMLDRKFKTLMVGLGILEAGHFVACMIVMRFYRMKSAIAPISLCFDRGFIWL